ncbi:MAG: rod shape-determining protein MreC [Candidatus Parcubacteria bacterium]|nr:rod shape-determining protein MreC [Candidatus Parcubacteria bacterium]
MRTILPLNNNFPKRNIFLGIILGLFLILFIFFAPARNVVVRFFVAVSHPLLNLNKKNDEVSVLKNRVAELESKILMLESLEKENQELKAMFSHLEEAKKYILGAVISRPPQSPYDVLIIDAGSDNGVKEGMTATAFSNILLGYATDVFSKTSKIKLISFPGEETSALIESVSTGAKISALATGRGGGEMEIKLPSSLEIHSGDRITTPGTYPLMLGIVERAEINLSDPFQKIFFCLPVNIQELNYVMIEK